MPENRLEAAATEFAAPLHRVTSLEEFVFVCRGATAGFGFVVGVWTRVMDYIGDSDSHDHVRHHRGDWLIALCEHIRSVVDKITKKPLWDGLDNFDTIERVVHHVFRRLIQVRFDSAEGTPAADTHHHARVHALINQQTLCEAPTEIVT